MTDAIAEEDEWDAVSFVIASQYREDVLGRLTASPAVPTRIATDTEMRVEHVSRALRELRERSIVELLVPEDRRKGRIYALTERSTTISTTYSIPLCSTRSGKHIRNCGLLS